MLNKTKRKIITWERQINVIESFLKLLKLKDTLTAEHSKRVMIISIKFAKYLNIKNNLQALIYAALLHDIGKIGLPDNILSGHEKIDKSKFEQIRKHPRMGYDSLSNVSFLSDSVDAILHHHERIDGKGYPDGLKGKEICLFAKIIAIIDSYDAMTNDRTYHKAISVEAAIEEINKNKGSQFDSNLADQFIKFIKTKTGDEECITLMQNSRVF